MLNGVFHYHFTLDTKMHILTFGSEQSEHLSLRFAYPAPEKQGWIEADVNITAEAFRGSIQVIFELVDLLQFRTELARVYESLNGRADFKHRDRQLVFSVEGNGRGGITIKGHAYARPTWGNKLEFEIAIDQTFLTEPLAVLRAVAPAEEKVGV